MQTMLKSPRFKVNCNHSIFMANQQSVAQYCVRCLQMQLGGSPDDSPSMAEYKQYSMKPTSVHHTITSLQFETLIQCRGRECRFCNTTLNPMTQISASETSSAINSLCQKFYNPALQKCRASQVNDTLSVKTKATFDQQDRFPVSSPLAYIVQARVCGMV